MEPEGADAIVLASAEALRNVARHAGTDRAEIEVRGQGRGVVVTVTDRGCGIPDDTRWGTGLGESVVDRMAEVGGRARITSGRGGTTVELFWAPESPDERIARAWTQLARAMTPIVVPGLASTVLVGLLMLQDLSHPLLALAGLLVITVAGALVAWRGVWAAPTLCYSVLLGAAVVGFTANVFAAAPDTGNGYLLFLAGGGTTLLMLVAIHHTFIWSLLAVAVLWGTILGVGTLWFGFTAMTGPLFGAVTAPILILGMFVAKAVLTRVLRGVLAAQDQTLRSRLRAEDSARRHGAEDARLERTRALVAPFLEAVAAGQVDLDDPIVRRQAARLEAEVRDELRFGGTDDELATAIAGARRAGWQLEVRLTPDRRASATTGAQALLQVLGREADGSGRAFLSAFDQVALVVHDPAAARLRDWRTRADIQLEEGDQWCRLTTLAVGSPSRGPAGPAGVPVAEIVTHRS